MHTKSAPDDVAFVRSENENLRKIRQKLLQWEVKDFPLAPLTGNQQDALDALAQLMADESPEIKSQRTAPNEDKELLKNITENASTNRPVIKDVIKLDVAIDATQNFLLKYDCVCNEINEIKDKIYTKYLQELEVRNEECNSILEEIDNSIQKMNELNDEYEFVANKTKSLNVASEKLIQEQEQLNGISADIAKHLHYFTLAESLSQKLLNPTLSVTSENFKETLNRIDECLDYLKQHPEFKDSSTYIVKYKHCLSRAINLMKNSFIHIMSQAVEQILNTKQSTKEDEISTSESAFALYYGKFQTTAIKVRRISSIIEERLDRSPEYEQLLSEIHQNYLEERANVMSPAIDKAIKDLSKNHKNDHCSLMRSACAFLVHVCQDEHRLFFQFFSLPSEQLNSYLEGLCIILYDSLRPFIIHINHLETLAEVCSILRIEMLEEHVTQNPDSLDAFGKIAFQLLQDVQERLVFRAHLYLQSDILNYNPSSGDLAYPDKLEMMESIALSLQEPSLKRTNSGVSLVSNMSSATHDDTESIISQSQARFTNSPADLHGMWYPTVRRTLVCLSRLYRCVDRPIFQGLSQEALNYCIQSISNAAGKIATQKTTIDGELFEIKHLLILREQIAPFRVDFTMKETSLDFSKIKTAAFGLLQKRKQLFSLGSNNALLEFLLDGTPQVKEHLLDSRKDVDKQLKFVCEQFIKDAVHMLVYPLVDFLNKAQHLLSQTNTKQTADGKSETATAKINYNLRQSAWATPQQISSYIQESKRQIKNKLSFLQRSMQLYLSNKDTEFIIFRPIRNNIISTFVKLEQLLTMNGYSNEDMIIANCPSAEQISILLSSASILAEGSSTSRGRKTSSSSTEGTSTTRKISVEKKVSFDQPSMAIVDEEKKELTDI